MPKTYQCLNYRQLKFPEMFQVRDPNIDYTLEQLGFKVRPSTMGVVLLDQVRDDADIDKVRALGVVLSEALTPNL